MLVIFLIETKTQICIIFFKNKSILKFQIFKRMKKRNLLREKTEQ